MFGRTLSRKAEHGHTRIYAGHGLGGAGGTNSNLGQLVGIGHGGNGHVAHYKHTVVAALGSVGEEQHGTAHASNARSCLDNLQGRTQHIACSVACTGQLAISIAALDNHATEVERVEHLFTCFFNGHALLLAQFGKEFGVFFLLGTGGRVDDSGLVNVAQAPLLGQLMDFVHIAKNDEVCHAVGQYLVGGFKCTFFRSFRKYNALLVCFGTRNKLFNEFHKYFYVYLFYVVLYFAILTNQPTSVYIVAYPIRCLAHGALRSCKGSDFYSFLCHIHKIFV